MSHDAAVMPVNIVPAFAPATAASLPCNPTIEKEEAR